MINNFIIFGSENEKSMTVSKKMCIFAMSIIRALVGQAGGWQDMLRKTLSITFYLRLV